MTLILDRAFCSADRHTYSPLRFNIRLGIAYVIIGPVAKTAPIARSDTVADRAKTATGIAAD
jgi:uncharacterized membrane protein